jgi:hypothetical protein
MCQNDVPKQISCLSYSNQFIESNRRSGKEGQSFSYGLGKIYSTQVYRLSSITSIMKKVQIYPTREIDVSEFVNEFKQCVLSMLSTAYTT